MIQMLKKPRVEIAPRGTKLEDLPPYAPGISWEEYANRCLDAIPKPNPGTEPRLATARDRYGMKGVTAASQRRLGDK